MWQVTSALPGGTPQKGRMAELGRHWGGGAQGARQCGRSSHHPFVVLGTAVVLSVCSRSEVWVVVGCTSPPLASAAAARCDGVLIAVLCRGTWARATIGLFRHLALQARQVLIFILVSLKRFSPNTAVNVLAKRSLSLSRVL